MSVLRASGATARLWIAGAGPQEGAIRELVRSLGLGEDVDFLGFRKDVGTLLHEASVLCLPSRSEAFPVAVLEAMRAGTPIVGAHVGGVAEQIGEGAGWLVSPENVDALAEALAEALGAPDEAERRASIAHQRYLRSFTAEQMVRSYAKLYQEISSARGAR